MYKKIILLITILLLIIFKIPRIDALELHSCVNDRTCMLVCSYSEEEKKTSADGHPFSSWNKIYIYYMFDTGEWQVSWDKVSVMSNQYDSVMGAAEEIFNSGYIHAQDNLLDKLVNEGICPNYAHVDREWGSNEVCFDTDGKYCQNNVGNGFLDISTGFYSCSDDLICRKEYDVNNSILSYLENFQLKVRDVDLANLNYDNIDENLETTMELICEDLRNEKITLEDLEDQIKNDFSRNFLNGARADFMSNWNSCLEVKNSLKSKYDPIISKLDQYCDEKVREDLSNGMIDEEEYEDLINKNDNASENLINNSQQSIDSAFDDVYTGSWEPIDVNDPGNCEDYLGDADTKGDPAYYIDFVYDIIKITLPIGLIAISMFDMVNAIVSEKSMNILATKFVKRIIIILLILLLPTLISSVGKLLIGKDILCGIG